MHGYWRSPEGLERKRLSRWLQTVRATIEQEPRQKGRIGRRAARHFRKAVRAEVAQQRDWPKARAALALDLDFVAAERQPPALWRLPKNYLDLLGATSATTEDPGPVLYEDDAQVKLLFASLTRSGDPAGQGRIHLQARTRTSAIHDMQLAGELLEYGELDDTTWAEADPSEALEDHDGDQYLPEDLAVRMQFNDKARYQGMLLGSNDRLLRSVFLQAARWLLTGRDTDIDRLRRLGLVGGTSVEDLIGQIAQTNAAGRELLWSTIRIELPSLPLQQGGGAAYGEDVRLAIREFVRDHTELQPLIVPLRVTVLVVPPKHRRGRVKDLDNILITVMSVLEAEMQPHAEPWALAPPISVDDSVAESEPAIERPRITGSQTWAYQVMELHRGPDDPDQGSLVVVPGLGWNRKSIWVEAEYFVAQTLPRLVEG